MLHCDGNTVIMTSKTYQTANMIFHILKNKILDDSRYAHILSAQAENLINFYWNPQMKRKQAENFTNELF